MKKSNLLLTRTAILLALTVLFQSLRVIVPIPPNISQFVVGSLVNLTLILAAVVVGLKGGLTIAILAPVIAFMQGFLPPFPIMMLLVAIGNVVLVTVVALLYHKNNILALGLGALLKFVALYIAVVQIAVPFILTEAPQRVRDTLAVSFSWPQLITAVIGSVLALMVLPLVLRALKH